ncbi:MAG: hypothetical protein WC517_05035, partial [Patescibacteria group bacterium]
MKEFEEVRQVLNSSVAKGKLADLLHQLLLLDDWQLKIVLGVSDNMRKTVVRQDDAAENIDRLNRLAGIFSQIIDLTATDGLNYRKLESILEMHHQQSKAVSYLPKPFQSQAVKGALELMTRAWRGLRHNYDLPSIAINWKGRLGEPVRSDCSESLLKQHPSLMPVIFSRGIDFSQSRLNQQFFGSCQALCYFGSKNVSEKIAFHRACKKWSLTDFYAFCPLPTWAADSEEEHGLQMGNRTWPEQQAELSRLQRLYPRLEVRFATLPELMYLDLCMRLATGNSPMGSPMGIYSFRCEHPTDSNKCL